jgi:hypothetical protein
MQNIDRDRLAALRASATGMDDLADLPPGPDPSPDRVERFWQYMTGRAPAPEFVNGLELLVRHLHSFWERRHEPNVVLLHYADLERDTEAEMRRLAGRLGIEIPEECWPSFVEAASFRSMSARASDLAPNAGDFWKDDNAFFHRGCSGQWQELVGDDGSNRYSQLVRELTDDEEFLAWLHRP